MNTIIQDVCDVSFISAVDGSVIFTAEAQLASLSQKVKEEPLKGGIGNRTIAVLRSDKEVALKVRNATFDSSWLEMVEGVKFANGTALVFKREPNLVVATKAVTITGTPKTGGKMFLVDNAGKQYPATFATGSLTTTETIADGTIVTAVYQAEVTGNKLSIDSKKFSGKYKVEYSTIEYNPDTMTIVNDLYIQFDSVLPSGNFDLSFENGKAQTPELDFTVLVPLGTSEVGRIIEVART